MQRNITEFKLTTRDLNRIDQIQKNSHWNDFGLFVI